MTQEDANKARQIVNQWFWQPYEGHNYRYRGALRTMTRFYESAPMEPDVVKLVIEYLRDEVIDGGISLLNKFVDLGSGWKAMDAWYRTDETEKWNGTDSRKVRVYQVLVQKPADGDAVDGPYQVDKGCRYRVTHTFSWNVEALPTVPASSSGVNYALEAVVRDQETGLYNCVLTKRERLQQDVAEYLSEVTQFQETREELHLGVKEGASAGKSAGVSAGKTVERHVTKNEDCTHDVRNVTRKDLPVSEAVVTTEETAFETRTTSESRNQSRAANAPAKPGESVRNEKTPTKLFNQVKTVTVEKPVKGAAVEFRKSLHGTVRSVTDRNQAAPVTDANLKIGERRSSRMTDGGNYDNTSEQLTAEPAGDVAATGRKTVFEESASKRENVAAGGVLPQREADEAGDGKTHSVEVVLHEDGSADVTKTDTTEKPVKGAVVEFRKTLHGTVKSVTDRSQAAPVTDADLKIGERRASRMTDGGLYDNTSEQLTAEPAGDVAAAERKTIFEKSASKRENVAAGGELPEREAEEAGGGKTHSVEVVLHEDGSADVVTSDTTEKPVKDAEVTKSKTLHGVRTRKLDRNQQAPSASEPQKIGESITTRKTAGGLVDVVTEEFAAKPAGKTAAANEESRHVKTAESVTNKAAPEPTEVSYADGQIVRKSSRLLEDSTADVLERVSTAKPSMAKRTWSDAYGTYTRCTYRNQPEPILPAAAGDYMHTNVSFATNDFGLFDGVYTVSDMSKSAGGGSGREHSNFTKTVNVKEERIVSSTRDGTSKVQYYQERTWKKVMRYNNNTGWYLEAMNDITSSPGQGAKLSRITGTYTWEYWMDPDEWGATKKRTIG